MERYGLHPALYPNNGLPMGLREASGLFGRKGISTDCLLCHGAPSGKSTSVLGTCPGDSGVLRGAVRRGRHPREDAVHVRQRVRHVGSRRHVRLPHGLSGTGPEPARERREFGLRDDLCEDPPAWWLLKKKTMYHTGGADGVPCRSIMQFMMVR